jgi:hypothetical protein
MANLMGVYTRADLNIVQQQMLVAVTVRKNKRESLIEEAKFEQQMMIVNPAMYNEYLKQKSDNAENEGAIWRAPESIEEARELEKIFSDIQNQLSKEELAADQQFIDQVNLMDIFNGINVDEIGGDE